jgi:hypothetical protein
MPGVLVTQAESILGLSGVLGLLVCQDGSWRWDATVLWAE